MIRADLRPLATAGMAALAAIWLASCSPPAKKPPDDQISRYISDQLPPYLSIRKIDTSYEAIKTLGTTKLAAGSWRVTANVTLRTAEDLYAVTKEARDNRTMFARAIAAAEQMRAQRIQQVEAFGKQLGLVKDPQLGPMPAFTVAVASHQGDELPDRVTLLAEPDGPANWKFAQLDAQTLDTTKLGQPLATLRNSDARLNLVLKGSPEEADFANRQARFLAGLARLSQAPEGDAK